MRRIGPSAWVCTCSMWSKWTMECLQFHMDMLSSCVQPGHTVLCRPHMHLADACVECLAVPEVV